MTTPQFTLRHLLALVTVCAISCLVLATGGGGRVWGVAVAITIVGALLLLLIHALLLLAARFGGALLNRLAGRSAHQHADPTLVAASTSEPILAIAITDGAADASRSPL